MSEQSKNPTKWELIEKYNKNEPRQFLKIYAGHIDEDDEYGCTVYDRDDNGIFAESHMTFELMSVHDPDVVSLYIPKRTPLDRVVNALYNIVDRLKRGEIICPRCWSIPCHEACFANELTDAEVRTIVDWSTRSRDDLPPF